MKAFTLIELMVTVIIIGIIAGFGIPTYTKMIDRAKERDATMNLDIMREATRIYFAREGSYPPALANIAAINTTLNINVMEQEGNTYDCIVASWYTCRADNTDGWQLRFRLSVSDGVVQCSIGPCTTL